MVVKIKIGSIIKGENELYADHSFFRLPAKLFIHAKEPGQVKDVHYGWSKRL
jgi:hypothetical protein